ncbi:MAG TPA: flagellin lysine-N-methylase [Bryobacteraceae bacterium]|nr:flagellin lysine-N-methylase [Bryobacteraceae bacterium]
MKPENVLQPHYFDAFHCLGSDCEDTCCIGWNVHIDKRTYAKHQNCSDSQLGSSLHTLITINEKAPNDDDYAKIVLNGVACPFLSEGLCSIQVRLGEEYLSNMCATYPRVTNRVGDVLHRSLDLSCPEAARVLLLNPEPIEFDEAELSDASVRLASVPALDTSGRRESPDRYRFFRAVRRMVISLLQSRSYPLWRRLFLLGCFCVKLDETVAASGGDHGDVLQAYVDNLNNDASGDLLTSSRMDPTAQLETVLELIVARISTDFNPRRFLECYQEFMNGIQWTSKSTMDQIGVHYAEAYSAHYAPFMSRHEHILEHYLVNYAHRTLFPFGLPESNQRLRNERVSSPILAQYMLMIANYAITNTVLIGMAGFHKSAFGTEHVIKALQSCTKTFEHSATFPGRAIEMLAEKAMTTPASLCVLIRN